MTLMIRPSAALAACVLTLLAPEPGPARAQAGATCASGPGPDGGILVIHCRNVIIDVEGGAGLTVVDPNRAGGPRSVRLEHGAAFFDDGPRPDGTSFQVRTPDAIASVRGTRWAVDVSATQSSVFVAAGAVAVRRRLDGRTVRLGPGEGVDVPRGDAGPLVVKRWPAPRVRALLRRVGQP